MVSVSGRRCTATNEKLKALIGILLCVGKQTNRRAIKARTARMHHVRGIITLPGRTEKNATLTNYDDDVPHGR